MRVRERASEMSENTYFIRVLFKVESRSNYPILVPGGLYVEMAGEFEKRW